MCQPINMWSEVFITICSSFVLASCASPQLYIHISNGIKLNHTINTISVSSLIACCDLCTADDACIAVSYNTELNMCNLNNKNPWDYPFHSSTNHTDWVTYGRTAPCHGSGWVAYNRACYKVVLQGAQWAQAQSHCLGIGGNLTDIMDENENQFVFGIVGGHNYWIGLKHLGGYVQVWVSAAPYVYSKFEPNNPSFGGEDCVIAYSSAPFWNDVVCSGYYASVCKKYNY